MQHKTINVGLVGVTGYTGMELARILSVHPGFTLSVVTSRTEAGKKLRDIYPFLQSFACGELIITAPDPEALARNCQLAFLAVPHGAAMTSAAELHAKGVKVVDLSADFRLKSPDVYAEWYGEPHQQPRLLGEAVYGLPELYAETIATASLIANPGCYPTASIFGLYPALKNGLIERDGIIIDAKSGTSGAGRKAAVNSLFCEVQDTFKAYGLPRHRHTPEIEQEVGRIAGCDITLSFTPHLLPVSRGILATIYGKLIRPDMPEEEIRTAYEKAYADKRFIRVLPKGRMPELRNVRGTMFCDIAVVADKRTGRLIMLSAIDNLCRGASGQAVANANLMCGLDMSCGLEMPPLVP